MIFFNIAYCKKNVKSINIKCENELHTLKLLQFTNNTYIFLLFKVQTIVKNSFHATQYNIKQGEVPNKKNVTQS